MSIEEVKARTDIVDLIGEQVQLKRSGRIYKGLCPFHDEKTPSFVVYPDSANWRCFGACATGGDVFNYLMRMQNLDFRGALEQLASRAGVVLEPLTPENKAKQDKRERLRDATSQAAEHFHRQLLRSEGAGAARDYLRARGLSIDIAQQFQLGWAADEWSELSPVLLKAGFSEEDLVDAQLARRRDSGGLYDLFRGRLTIPIHDVRGRAIGFGARTLDPEGIPKYLNSPQSLIFEKNQVLYGLNRAAGSIRKLEQAVVVEGYTDVIRAHAAGFENVVASLGTALTEGQIQLLKRYAKVIILALDADAAGQAATLRGLEVAREASGGDVVPVPTATGLIRYEQRMEVELRVAKLPVGQDPDDVIRESPAAWQELIANARPVMEHLFDVLLADLDLASPKGVREAADRLLPMIAEVSNRVERRAWIGRLAQLTRVEERDLEHRLSQIKPRKKPARRPRKGAAEFGEKPAGTSSAPSVPSLPARKTDSSDPASAQGTGPTISPSSSSRTLPPTSPQTSSAPDEPPDWATADMPLDAEAAAYVPEAVDPEVLEPGALEPGILDPEGLDPRPVHPGSAGADRGAMPDPMAAGQGSRPSASSGAAGRDLDLLDVHTAWLLGHLLVDPLRLQSLNSSLVEVEQAALRVEDFEAGGARSVFDAVLASSKSAEIGGEPELPAELGSLAEQLRMAAVAGPDIASSRMIEDLRICVLRMRKRRIQRTLAQLRYMLDGPGAKDMDTYTRIRDFSVEIQSLTQALTELVGP